MMGMILKDWNDGVVRFGLAARRDRTRHNGRRRLGSDVEARLLLDGGWMF